MSGIPWSKEEEHVLRKMAEKGLSPNDMVRVLKQRTSTSISTKLKTMGIKLKDIMAQRVTDRIDEEARRLFDV